MDTARLAPALAGWAKLGGAAVLALSLAACSGGSLFGGGEGGLFGGGSTEDLQNTNASQTEIAAAAPSALPAIATECPPIRVRQGAEAYARYARGQTGNPQGLAYQAVLDRQSRNCVVSNGLITVRMGVVGRLLLGPQGTSGSYQVPVRFAVERDGVAVFSELYTLPVSIQGSEQSGEFVKVVENVAIPYLGNEDITIWVGFDNS